MTLGIPSGSLFEATVVLLKKMEMDIVVNGRNFNAEITGNKIFSKAMIIRPNDLPLALKKGIVDAVITGYDMLAESGLEKEWCVIQELNYSKKSKQPARVVLFCRKDDPDEIIDSEEIFVSSEYPGIAKKIFKKARIIFSTGSTEIKVSDARFGFLYGIGIVETGKSLEDNGLKILKTLLISPVVLLAREKSEEMEIFGQMLKGALDAETFKLLKFNADKEDIKQLVKILPASQSPTVSNLADGAVAIETVVPKNIMADTIAAVKKAGGRNILAQAMDIFV